MTTVTEELPGLVTQLTRLPLLQRVQHLGVLDVQAGERVVGLQHQLSAGPGRVLVGRLPSLVILTTLHKIFWIQSTGHVHY